jgi:sec-independent protein translocase protein TatA
MILPLYIPGHWELIIVVIAILVLFGGRKIPEMMRGMGTGIKEFKKGIRDEEDDGKRELDNSSKSETVKTEEEKKEESSQS